MLDEINLTLILAAALAAVISPGPATLAIAGTSMSSGRPYGLALASGITTGSFIWSISAAFGLGAIMLANAWVFEVVRYFGACYLLFLAFKSARSALNSKPAKAQGINAPTPRAAYVKGVMLHLTNPKAVLFFGSLYSIGLPPNSSPEELGIVIAAVGTLSTLVFHSYALIFSNARITAGYAKLRRWFEAGFAAVFGYVGFKILTT